MIKLRSEDSETRWAMLHSPLHDAGFLLNPAYRLNEPWKDEAVVSGTTNLLKKWNHSFFGGKLDIDRDFPVEPSLFPPLTLPSPVVIETSIAVGETGGGGGAVQHDAQREGVDGEAVKRSKEEDGR